MDPNFSKLSLLLKGQFSIRTFVSQFKCIDILVNVHLVLLLVGGKYQKYLLKPVDKLSKIRYPIPNFCATFFQT